MFRKLDVGCKGFIKVSKFASVCASAEKIKMNALTRLALLRKEADAISQKMADAEDEEKLKLKNDVLNKQYQELELKKNLFRNQLKEEHQPD